MAEVIGFGASVLTFITIATQLAKAAFATYETVTDAHEEIKRVRTRLNDLRFILLQIYHRRIHSSSTGEPDPAYWDDKSARYWDEKSAQLGDSFAQLERITSRLNETQPVARLRWLLSGQDRARKLLALLTEDLAVLKTLNQFMLESYNSRYQARCESYLEGIFLGLQAQAPIMPNLLHVVQKVDEINEMVLAKGELAVVYRTAQTDRLRPCLKTGNTEQIHRSNIGILVSGVRRKITSYNLPFGKIIVHYGIRSEPSPGQGGLGSEHFAMRGTWEFQPASWISYRSIITEAQLLIRCGAELAHPTITSSLTTRSALSWEHPIWKYIQHGDVMGVQRLLRTGAVRATDMGTNGSTLLHSVCLNVGHRDLAPEAVKLLALLINSGVDCNAVDGAGLTALSYMVTPHLVRRPESRQSLNCVAGMQLIIDAGGEFGFPWGHCSTAFHLNPTYAYSALKGTSYSEVLKDCLQEHAARLFSKDPEYPSVALVFLLTDMVCGQFIEVQDLWRQIRPNLFAPVTDTASLFNFMVADLVSTAEKVYSDGAISTWLWVMVIDRVFVNCTNAGEIDQANRILTSLVARSSSFVKHLNISFSQRMGNPYHVPIDLLYGCNRETLDILEWNGISPDVVDYRLMQERLLDDRAFPEFLWRRISISTMFDWMLVCASDYVEFSEHVLPLLREGADVNYVGWDCPYFGEDFSVPRTPLGAAVRAGEKETVQLLLDYGADVLLDSEERSSLSGIATVGGYQELAEMLEKLEVKEQTKRNLSTVPEIAVLPQTKQNQAPKTYLDHITLVLGMLLTTVDVIRLLILYGLGWVLRNRRLLCWIWSTCFYFAMPVVKELGWAILGAFFEQLYLRQSWER